MLIRSLNFCQHFAYEEMSRQNENVLAHYLSHLPGLGAFDVLECEVPSTSVVVVVCD